MTTWCMWACGLKILVSYFNVKTHDIWEGNVTTRSQIEHPRSLGFHDIREGVK